METSVAEPIQASDTPPVEFDPETNVQTALCVGYLTAQNEQDRARFFVRLVAYCKTKCAALYVPPTDRALACDHDTPAAIDAANYLRSFSTKKDAIEIAILEELAPYHGLSESEIKSLAAKETFRYVARRVFNRVRNEIKKRWAAKRKEPADTVSLDAPAYKKSGKPIEDSEGEHLTWHDICGKPDSQGDTFANIVMLSRALEHNFERFTKALGRRGFEALKVLVALSFGFEGTRGDVSRIISESLHVTKRQARNVLHELVRHAPEVTDPMIRGALEYIFGKLPFLPLK